MSSTTSAKPKNEKKDKSAKKRKASEPSEEIADLPESTLKSSSKRSRKEAAIEKDVTEDPLTAEATTGEVDDSEAPPTKKRKSSVEEIEVDVTKPTPPSRKALRLLKKGKPLPPSKSGAESTPELEEKAKKPEVEKRSEHAIWIGNLPWTASKEDLRKFFIENSDITEEMITRIHMPSPDDKKPANKVMGSRAIRTQHNTGFAYVDFSTAAGVEEALELSEQLLGGRAVLIKNHKSFEGRPLKTKEETRMEGKAPNKRVFVGNLRFDMTPEALNEHFEVCGPIATSFLATFEDSGKCKGYGWITFEDIESAANAVKGFVLVPQDQDEDEEEEEAAAEEKGSDDDSDEDVVPVEKKPKKVPMRRQYVNMIQRRPVRVEFAEDAQTRYKKQYGKGGSKGRKDAEGGATEGSDKPERPARVLPTKTPAYRKDYAPRLTGGIVESKGKKVVF